eukprot:TRINITY_DN51325_c0_g1_i2.p1 TRINITY_DN51325_c0_g1~~TRINITY_DN51325_c0_g1_i2.p1  ORF type:complete len:267 (-),score=39.34 TRINITY_DN51325_c0_g1_i2:108-908(-)
MTATESPNLTPDQSVLDRLIEIGATHSAKSHKRGPQNKGKHCWSSHTTGYRVRGANYLQDRVKVHHAPSQCAMAPVHVEILPSHFEAPKTSACEDPEGFLQAVMQQDWGDAGKPFVFCVQWMIPCSAHNYQVNIYWCQTREFLSPAWQRFVAADAASRNLKFKMIPKVVEGSWIVKKACGETPAILGKKLPQHFSSSPNFFEILIDVTESTVAGSLVSLMLSYAKSLVVDMAFVVEGQAGDELPEEIIGGIRLSRIDLKSVDSLLS